MRVMLRKIGIILLVSIYNNRDTWGKSVGLTNLRLFVIACNKINVEFVQISYIQLQIKVCSILRKVGSLKNSFVEFHAALLVPFKVLKLKQVSY